jgi:hypothetical protein
MVALTCVHGGSPVTGTNAMDANISGKITTNPTSCISSTLRAQLASAMNTQDSPAPTDSMISNASVVPAIPPAGTYPKSTAPATMSAMSWIALRTR